MTKNCQCRLEVFDWCNIHNTVDIVEEWLRLETNKVGYTYIIVIQKGLATHGCWRPQLG